MDRNFYIQNRSQEQQREISQELNSRHLLEGVKHQPLTAKQGRQLVMRLAPVIIALTIFLVFSLLI